MADLHAQLAAVRAACPLQRVDVAGHTWTYVESGRGRDTLLLLPGAMGEADTSFQYILALQEHHSVISLSYPATIATVTSLVDSLNQVLATLHIPRAHVVGGSYSGLVAQFLATAHPGRVASLLLSNIGAPDPAYAPRWRLAANLLAPLPASFVHQVIRATIRRFLRGDSPAQCFWRDYFAAAIPTLHKDAMLARLRLAAEMHAAGERLRRSSYRGPVLIVDATEDALVPAHQRAALRALYPQAHHVAIADKGHVASLDEATSYIAIYQEFLCHVSP